MKRKWAMSFHAQVRTRVPRSKLDTLLTSIPQHKTCCDDSLRKLAPGTETSARTNKNASMPSCPSSPTYAAQADITDDAMMREDPFEKVVKTRHVRSNLFLYPNLPRAPRIHWPNILGPRSREEAHSTYNPGFCKQAGLLRTSYFFSKKDTKIISRIYGTDLHDTDSNGE